MAAKTQTYREILNDIKKGQPQPVYLLFGEEGYFLDQLTKAFEEMVPESERDFNLYSLYAHEISADAVISTCMRYPMFSERQVVILKEAQAVKEPTLNKLAQYVAAPNPTTVLVMVFRSEKAKGRELTAKARTAGAVFFESRRLNDANADSIISAIIKDKGLNIEPKGLAMLREFIGTDVAKMYNEVNKLALILPKGSMINPEVIETHIGISKDFNNFELIDAIKVKDAGKIFRIIEYFKNNPKNHPAIVTVAWIYNFFSNLIIAQFTRDKSPSSLMGALNIKWQSGIQQYLTAMRYYNAYQTLEILSAIRQYDVQSKGIGSRQADYDLLHDLMFHILTAPGKIEL